MERAAPPASDGLAPAKVEPAPSAADSTPEALRAALLGWYGLHRRSLPWRRTRDSYRIWVAETMLQQTRVAVVVPAYRRFVRAFPSLRRLAAAPEEIVLSLWSGLGYYTRARNLHRAARRLADQGQGEFPRDVDAARSLPGVGAYTAAAVLSIAYDVPLAAVDGNVVRVLSRLFCLPRPDARGRPHAARADSLLDRRRPGDWNQAVMELGETVCLPVAPRCEGCPVARFCAARQRDATARYPGKRPRPKRETVHLDVLVVRDRGGRILLERGAFPFLSHLWLPPTTVRAAAVRGPSRAPSFRSADRRGEFRHAILHRDFRVRVYERAAAPGDLRPSRRKEAPRRERRWFDERRLQDIGRSGLLVKALRFAAMRLAAR